MRTNTNTNTDRIFAATAKAQRAATRANNAEHEATTAADLALSGMGVVADIAHWENATEGAKAIARTSWEKYVAGQTTKARAAAEKAWRASHTAARAAQEAAKMALAIATDPTTTTEEAERAAEMACEAGEFAQSAWEDAHAAEGYANQSEGKQDPWGEANARADAEAEADDAAGCGADAWETTMARANGQISAKAARQTMGR